MDLSLLREPNIKMSALDWFLGINSESCPISFVDICDYLDLEPEAVLSPLRARGAIPSKTLGLLKEKASTKTKVLWRPKTN